MSLYSAQLAQHACGGSGRSLIVNIIRIIKDSLMRVDLNTLYQK